MSDAENNDQEQGPPAEIFIGEQAMAGVWANFARVTHSEHEFTLDFVRMDYSANSGIVVSRVAVSPLFITQLIEALDDNWSKYAKKALPPQVHNDEPNDTDT